MFSILRSEKRLAKIDRLVLSASLTLISGCITNKQSEIAKLSSPIKVLYNYPHSSSGILQSKIPGESIKWTLFYYRH